MLGLESASNALYSDRKIVYHLLNAFTSKTSVSNICDNALSKGIIMYRLRNIDLDKIQQSLNEKLKIHSVKTMNRKRIELAIDYTNKSYYGEEESYGDTIKTKPKQGTSRFFTKPRGLKLKHFSLIQEFFTVEVIN